MSTPYTIQEPLTLIISDRGVATPAAHAASHAAAGSDPLTLTLAQISNAGTIASQNANAVALTGGTIAGVTITYTAGTINGVVIGGTTPAAATFTTLVATAGTLNGIVIGGTTPAAATFTDIGAEDGTFSGAVTADTLTLTNPLPLASGGTNSTTATGARAALGIGTMGTQNSSAVSISGGTIAGVTFTISGSTIDSSPIGATTPSTGAFTTLSTTGAAALSSLTLTTKLAVAQGGTGASTVLGAQQALDLEPSVDVQAYSAKLAAIHTLTWAADKVPYFTGTGTLATADLPTFGRTLIANTTKELARADLGFATWEDTLSSGTAVVTDAAILSTSLVWVVPTSTSVNAGHLDVVIVAASGYTITSTNGSDDRDIRVIIVY